MKTHFTISGTHCESCKMLIEDVARDIAGIAHCSVDPQTGRTVVDHAQMSDLQSFKQEVEKIGEYRVQLP